MSEPPARRYRQFSNLSLWLNVAWCIEAGSVRELPIVRINTLTPDRGVITGQLLDGERSHRRDVG